MFCIDGNNYYKLRDLAKPLDGTGSQFDVGCVTVKTGCVGEKHLDIHPKHAIMNIEKALPRSGSALLGFYCSRNRHLAEWRFLLFTRIVTVQNRTWNVNVIGIATPPFTGAWRNRLFSLWQRLPIRAPSFYVVRQFLSTKTPPDKLVRGRCVDWLTCGPRCTYAR